MSKIDQNYNYVAMAKTDDVSGSASPLKVDPVTGRLLVSIYFVSSSISVLNSSKIDNNFEPTSLVYDETNVRPLLIDNRNGFLWTDLLIE